MAKKRVRFMKPRGYRGSVIARGAVMELDAVWADRFIADGTAVEETKAAKPKAEKDTDEKSNGKRKGK